MSTGLSELEQYVVRLIESNLHSKEIDARQAKLIATAVLTHLKSEMTEFQLYQAAEGLSKNFPELTGVAAKAKDQYEDRIRDAVIHHAGSLLKEDNIEQASTLLENALTKDHEIRIDG